LFAFDVWLIVVYSDVKMIHYRYFNCYFLVRVPTTFLHCLARHALHSTRRISVVHWCITRKLYVLTQHVLLLWGLVWVTASWSWTSPKKHG